MTYLLKKYKESKPIEKRDWRTYEPQLMKRVKGAIHNLEPLIGEVTNIEIHRGPGRPPELNLKQSVTVLLVKELIGKSNRSMASMLDLFSLISGIDVSYKKVERLYSNYDVLNEKEVYLVNVNIYNGKLFGIINVFVTYEGHIETVLWEYPPPIPPDIPSN